MGLFNKNREAAAGFSQRQVVENAIKGTRNNILIVLAFTALNIVLLLTNSYTYFLFSAFVPYMLVDYGMFFGGIYPAEYYGEYLSEMEFLGKGFFGTMVAIAVAILAVYAVCWLRSKKNAKPWLMLALVMFGIDTVLLLVMQGFNVGLIMDYVFHGWIIVSLVTGLSAVKKLKDMPEEEEETEQPQETMPIDE